MPRHSQGEVFTSHLFFCGQGHTPVFSALQILSVPGLGLVKMTFLWISKLDVSFSGPNGCLSPPRGEEGRFLHLLCAVCTDSSPLPRSNAREFNSLWTKGRRGGRRGWGWGWQTKKGARQRLAAPPLQPAFSEPQPGRALQTTH